MITFLEFMLKALFNRKNDCSNHSYSLCPKVNHDDSYHSYAARCSVCNTARMASLTAREYLELREEKRKWVCNKCKGGEK